MTEITGVDEIFHGSLKKNIAVSGLFVVVGSAVAAKGLFPIALSVGVFGVLAFVFLLQGAIGLPTLRIEEEGFEISTGFAKRTFQWAECEEFHIRHFCGPTSIGFIRNGADGVILNQFNASTRDICAALVEKKHEYSTAT